MRELLSKRFATTQRGLTLIEAMITLAIAAILLTWAVPSLKDFITRNRMSTEVNNFVAALYVARSESVKRLRNVGVCPSTDGAKCTGTSDWKLGWIVFEDTDNTNSNTIGDIVLQYYAALPTRFRVDTSSTIMLYAPNGRLSSVTNNTYRFRDCDNVAKSRFVVVSGEGRVKTDPVDETVSCP